jgi:hypothetical protein
MKKGTPFIIKFAVLTTVTVVVVVIFQILIVLKKKPTLEISEKTLQPFEFSVDQQFVMDYQNRLGL